MSVYADVMPIGLAELRMDVRIFSKKLMTAYLDLVAYFHRWGSVPSDEKSLAGVMNVTVRYLHKVAWPFLEVRLEMSDDGQRYFDPDISAVRQPRSGRAQPPAKVVRSDLSEVRRQAAYASHAARREWPAAVDRAPSAGENDLQTILQTDAKLSAKSSPVASGLQDGLQTFAGFAGDVAGAPSPSLTSSLSFKPTESQPERKEVREREDADAGVRGDVQTGVQTVQTVVQNSVQTDANRDAKPDANRDAKPRREKPAPPPPRKVPLPDDWQPTAEAVAKIKASGRDPDHMAAAFRYHYKAVGATRADWDAAFEAWRLKQPQFDPPPRQTYATMAIPGGKPASEPKGAWLSKSMRRSHGGSGDEDDARIIEGKLG